MGSDTGSGTSSSSHSSVPPQRVLDRFDRGLRDLRVSVVDRCNFRCNYCMPAEVYGDDFEFLPQGELLTYEEITRLVRIFCRLGVRKVRLTGGEPLLRREIEKLVEMVGSLDEVRDLAMTTNGYLLSRHARSLADAGLHRVNVSLDALDPESFARMSGRDWGRDEVLRGIEAALEADLEPVKVNCVVRREMNDDQVLEMVRRFRETGVILRFIEYMDVGSSNGWRLDDVVPSRELVERIDAEYPLEPLDERYPGEVANRYRYRDGAGQLGFVSSVTQPFCGDCTRARLSSLGELVTCLFATSGTDLKGPLRSGADDGELEELIRSVWQGRTDRYSEIRTAATDPESVSRERAGKVEMFRIGG